LQTCTIGARSKRTFFAAAIKHPSAYSTSLAQHSCWRDETTVMEGQQQLPFATTACTAAAVVVVVQTMKNQHPVERRCAVYNSVLMMHAAALVCAGEDNSDPDESRSSKRSFDTTPPSYGSSQDESKQLKRPRRVSNENEDWSPFLGYPHPLQPGSYHPQDNNLANEC
jgi:hypothetical protein